MSVVVTKGCGFFVLRNDGVQSLGPEWPSGAVASFARRKAAAVFARDRVTLDDGYSVEDQLDRARSEIETGKAKAVAVARAVGRFGDATVYERVWDVLGDGAAAVKLHEASPSVGGRETKTVHLKIQKSGKVRRIEGLASTPNIDRDMDVVDPSAFNASLQKFMQNPIMLFNHDVYRPIGKVVEVSPRDVGLWIAGEISDEQVWKWIEDEVLRTFSVSFIIEDRKIETVPADDGGPPTTVRRITKAELLEVSVVSLPANRQALFAMSKALRDGDDLECRGCKAPGHECECAGTRNVVEHRRFALGTGHVVDFRRSAVAGVGGRDAVRLTKLFDVEGAGALRHHGVENDEVVTSKFGVRCAMAALVGHDLTAALSEPERLAAWRHLAEHYDEMDETPPALGKGPEPERVGAIVKAGGGAVALDFDRARFEDVAACRKWMRARGFGELKSDAGLRFGAGVGFPVERVALDEGVSADLYRVPVEGDAVTVKSEKGDAKPDAGEKPGAPAAPDKPADQPAASPAPETGASKAEPKAEGGDSTEVDTTDLHALEHPDDVDPDVLERAVRNVCQADESSG